MARDPRYDILFEPVRIGPVIARNRFYQVPHCNGAGIQFPHGQAAMRGMKAEGGWAVVNTEWCSVHPSMDIPAAQGTRLWSREDVRVHALMVEAVHRHGALAGCELAHAGLTSHNSYSRLTAMGPSARPMPPQDFPGHGRAMTRDDIRNIRRWHREGVRRALEAGFDLVYVYASHGITVFTDFLSPRINRRTDEYGGCFENRLRLLRETLEDVMEEAQGRCAVALRFGVDEKDGPVHLGDEECRAVVESLAEVPDLWDVNIGGPNDMLTSRFRKEGWQESSMAFVKALTSRPVVGVGRFTSPDTMAAMVRRGVVDFIGAARPSIADPFLPRKIEEGRIDDIRECIGCNVCLASDMMSVPIRCTQNPTMSEEWRRGWHPERLPRRGSSARVLVVGAGPAGLEAARTAGERGYEVTLAEAGPESGGHLNRMARLPGLEEWIRVRDWRIGQIDRLNNVEVYRNSRLNASDVTGWGFGHVIVATGSLWRRDGVGRTNIDPVQGHECGHVLTPDDVPGDARLQSPVVIFDDDPYVVGGALAERLACDGHRVLLVGTGAMVSPWTRFATDQADIHRRLVSCGVDVLLNHNLVAIRDGSVSVAGIFGEPLSIREAASVVLVTMRHPQTELADDLGRAMENGAAGTIQNVVAVGDCRAPGLISEAVFSGHLAARSLDETDPGDLPFRVEQVPAHFQFTGNGR